MKPNAKIAAIKNHLDKADDIVACRCDFSDPAVRALDQLVPVLKGILELIGEPCSRCECVFVGEHQFDGMCLRCRDEVRP